MHAVVQKWGNSLGIRIPSMFVKDFSLKSGSSVEIFQEKEKIIIFPKKNTLDQMLAMVTDENKHSAVETGASVGNEKW